MDVWPLPRVTFRALGTLKESRPVALITSPDNPVAKQVSLPLVVQAEPTRNDRDMADTLANNLPSQTQAVYAIGDDPMLLGLAKLVATRNSKPLVIILPVISSASAFSAAIRINDNGQLTQVAYGPADEVIIDFDLIKAAPADQRGVGVVDVLSIITALLDWTYAAQKNQLPADAKMAQWAVAIGAGLAAQAIKTAPAIGKGDSDALRMLIDLICLTVQLDNQLGHTRLSHGTEHLFADAYSGAGSHAEKVGAGILLASALQNKDRASIRSAMEAAGVNLTHLKPDDIRNTFNTLPDYARQRSAPYTILNDLQPNSKELADALSKSTLFGNA